MKPSEAVREIIALTNELKQLGGSEMSIELNAFLDELAVTPDPKAVKKSATVKARTSPGKTSRVGTPKRQTEADMSKTIDELAKRLREAFNSDDRFETVLSEPQLQLLSKSSVVTLYNRVFEEPRPLPKSMTKPEIFNAIRRERINRVRSGY